MNIDNYVNDIVQQQVQNGCDFFSAVSSAEDYLKLKYEDHVKELSDAFLKLRMNYVQGIVQRQEQKDFFKAVSSVEDHLKLEYDVKELAKIKDVILKLRMNYVQDIVQREVQNGCEYYRAVADTKNFLELVYKDDAKVLAEIQDVIVKLRFKDDINKKDICKFCKLEMEIFEYDECKLCCPRCGLIAERDVSYMLTPYGYISEKPKPVFNPNKHFTDWLNQIMGYVSPKDKSVIKTIKQYCLKNNIHQFSLASLRKILKDLQFSKYNKYTSYFLIELTGIALPTIPDVFITKANFLFKSYITTRAEIRSEHPSFGKNNPPYPYLIYKIFNAILPPDDTKNRRILHFIHLPSAATLKKRDEEWDIVWNKLNKLVS